MKTNTNKLLTQMVFIFVLLPLFVGPVGCSVSQPPFQGGIRMVAIAQESLTGAQTPVSGIPDAGTLQSRVGPGNGSTSIFADETNSLGIDDITDAVTNAYWDTGENWTTRFPDCIFPTGAGSCQFINAFVDVGGGRFTCVCNY